MEEENDAEEPQLSLLQMTASLTRGQASKLFYQICGECNPCSGFAYYRYLQSHLGAVCWLIAPTSTDVIK